MSRPDRSVIAICFCFFFAPFNFSHSRKYGFSTYNDELNAQHSHMQKKTFTWRYLLEYAPNMPESNVIFYNNRVVLRMQNATQLRQRPYYSSSPSKMITKRNI